jgi:hypothetical protein
VHSLIHTDYAKAASAQREQPTRAVPPDDRRPHGPPGRVRVVVARRLAATASRIDREAARRAVA